MPFNRDAWVAALRLRPRDFGGVLEIELDGGDTFHLVIAEGVELRQGRAEKPTAILRARAEDFADLANGELGVTQALIDGRLRVSGDVIRAAALVKLVLG